MGAEEELFKKKSALQKEYAKALEDKDDQRPKEVLLDILRSLEKETKVNQELLKKTGIGKTLAKVMKLGSGEYQDVSNMAKNVIEKWKKDMLQQKNSSLKAQKQMSHKAPMQSPVARSVAPTSKESQPSSTASSPKTPSSDTGLPRTIKTDGINYETTGSTPRDKSMELMYASLALGSNADSDLILKRAVEIEKALLQEFGAVNDGYKSKARSLALNLKNKSNPGLRESIVSGELTVQKFCKMSVEDMASEEKKAQDTKLAEVALFKARGAESAQAETDMFKCGKCKKRRCTYFQMQTRSADEPMTTFVTCVECGNRWKFC